MKKILSFEKLQYKKGGAAKGISKRFFDEIPKICYVKNNYTLESLKIHQVTMS